MNEKKQYLDYIDNIYKRRINKVQASGVTKWALLIATVYLIQQIIPHLSLFQNPILIHQIGKLYLYSYCGLAFFYVVITPFSTLSSITSYDYRINFPTLHSTKRLLLKIFFSIFIPATIAYVIWVGESPFQLWVKRIDAVLFLFLSVAIMACVIHEWCHFKITTYPYFGSISSPQSPPNLKIVIFLLQFFIIVLGFANLACSYFSAVDILNVAEFNECIKLSFYLVTVHFVLNTLIGNISILDKTDNISRLERDILMYDLSEQDIKNRIEEDILGDVPLHSWLNQKLSDLKLKEHKVEGLAGEAYNKQEELSKIAQEYQVERKTIRLEYTGSLLSSMEEYIDDAKKMSTWLRKFKERQRYQRDPYLLHIIEEMGTKLDESLKRIEKKYKSAYALMQKTV